MSKLQKILLLMLFLGFAGNIGGSGTLASFNASTTNASSSFATGSIVLSNKVNSSNTCFSNGTTATNGGTGTSTDANNNTACEAFFNLTAQKPGQTATVNLNLKNEGSLPGALTLKAVAHKTVSGAASASQACTNEAAVGQTAYTGTGDICDKLRFTIQRYTTDARTTATASPNGCVYGQDTTPADGTCDAATDGFDLKHFTGTSLAASTGISLGTLAASDTAYLTLKVEFADGGAGLDNAFQGRAASFAVQWALG